MIQKVNLTEKANSVEVLFQYLKVGQLNDHMLNVLQAENRTLDFHVHEQSDELFYCIEGEFDIEFDDGMTHLSEGDLIIIPKGISHRPICKGLVKCLLIEKEGTLTSENTGGTYDDAKEPIFQDIKSRITESEVGVIISYAAFDGSPEGVAKEAETYLSSDKLNFYGWVEGSRVIGICGFEVHSDKVEIHLIYLLLDILFRHCVKVLIITVSSYTKSILNHVRINHRELPCFYIASPKL